MAMEFFRGYSNKSPNMEINGNNLSDSNPALGYKYMAAGSNEHSGHNRNLLTKSKSRCRTFAAQFAVPLVDKLVKFDASG